MRSVDSFCSPPNRKFLIFFSMMWQELASVDCVFVYVIAMNSKHWLRNMLQVYENSCVCACAYAYAPKCMYAHTCVGNKQRESQWMKNGLNCPVMFTSSPGHDSLLAVSSVNWIVQGTLQSPYPCWPCLLPLVERLMSGSLVLLYRGCWVGGLRK